MRAFVRLLLTVGLVTSAGSLAPLAATASPAVAPSTVTGTVAGTVAGPSTGTRSGTSTSPAEVAATSEATSASPTAPGTADPGTSDDKQSTPTDPAPSAPPGATTTSPVAPSTPAAAGQTRAPLAARRITSLTTTITAQPTNPTTIGTASFSYAADAPSAAGVTFRCRIAGPGRPATSTPPISCPANGPVSDTTTTGTIRFTGLKGDHAAYRFTVQAILPGATATAPPQVVGSAASYSWNVFTVYSRNSYVPPAGARFNDPLGSVTENRRNLSHVVQTVNSMPGYREAHPGLCPTAANQATGEIKISLYSLTDAAVAGALTAAARRCVSVKVLMNDHLDVENDPAWAKLVAGLGSDRSAASFAHTCSRGCRGNGVLHTKMYLFDAHVPDRPGLGSQLGQTVMVGSSNMTSNAAKVQWNDLYTARNRPALYAQFVTNFNAMARDNGISRSTTTHRDGPFTTLFFPRTKGATDPYLTALRTVRCTGVTGGAGLGGRTVVYINMHAWFEDRGMALANQVRRMYNAGCQVRVLYSFMSFAVFKKLKQGTGPRMVVRRTLFSKNGTSASDYSHFKNIAVSGNVAGSTSARVVWTGSNNFTDTGLRFDEVMIRIASASAFGQYRNQWNYMMRRRSAATYANYSEPTGGGRAP
ncbi:MAG: phospholipase D-like domain-containing protein [Nocardioidaceae bacterium]